MPDWQIWEIRFTAEQCLWLLGYIDTLREGNYPCRADTSYTDMARVQRSRSKVAPFTRPCELAGEIEVRLKRTGTDGKLLLWQAQAGVEVIDYLEYEAKQALYYISGWRRKRQSYALWKKDTRQRLRRRLSASRAR